MKKTSLVSTLRWALSGLLLLAMLAAAVPQPAQAASPAAPAKEVTATCDETYTVKANDSIYKVAKLYEMSAYKLARANNLEKPWTLTVGQKLCIPGEPTVSTKLKWTAKFSNGQVTLTGSGFPKRYAFFVKVRENDTSAWNKLGSTHTDRDGDLSAKFSVPKDLVKKTSLRVCLKDAQTDALLCKQVYRQ